MRINKKIPLKKFTDNVRCIILMPEGGEYTSMICTMPEQDIKTAISVMEGYDICKNKQELCKTELRMREIPGRYHLQGQWREWFSVEWLKVTKKIRSACGYEC